MAFICSLTGESSSQKAVDLVSGTVVKKKLYKNKINDLLNSRQVCGVEMVA